MGIGLKEYLPRSLLGRSLLIVVTPLVILQVVSAFMFYESHWDKVSRRMARSLAGDVASLIAIVRRYPEAPDRDWAFSMVARNKELSVNLLPGAILPNEAPPWTDDLGRLLADEMAGLVQKPIRVDTESVDRHVIIDVQLPDGVLTVVTTRKRLSSPTTTVFVLWMVGTSLILLGVATIFMRNQVRPIRRLAVAADAFGKGRDVTSFKPEGAKEVRQAASAFLAMRERIQRQISQRTAMLAGVSHDLRTPLTRMRLQMEMMGVAEEAVTALKGDIAEMEHMLEGYLAFARGEGSEPQKPSEMGALLADVVAQARRNGGVVDLHTEGPITVPVRPNAFRRCVTNLLENALRYARHVSVRIGRRDDTVELLIDDDGPGIPEAHREDVFKPFYRLEGSRNPVTGGVGLGLTIARDVVRNHGGDIALADAPTGGLRVRVRLPL